MTSGGLDDEIHDFSTTDSLFTINNGITRSAASSGTQTLSPRLHLGTETAWTLGGSGGLLVSGTPARLTRPRT